MISIKAAFPILLGAMMIVYHSSEAQKRFALIDKPEHDKMEVRYDGKLLTAYCYFDSTEKPVLFPLKTLAGTTVTRGYPVAPREGERTDHPHHLGLWLNYESVNGFDFWNNSNAISSEKKSRYGSIRHQKILRSESGEGDATIETLSHWVNQGGEVLLEELTKFVFTVKGSDFIIDRISTLEAKIPEVVFSDVKDGMLGVRVARELELPSSKESGKYVDAQGNETAVSKMSYEKITGMYQTSEGVKGDDAWGTRGVWASLSGSKDGEMISIVIIDHPGNIGFPTYWHARGYGLFAANPLGLKVFSEGKAALNLTLKKGEKVTFRYRVIVHGAEDPIAVSQIGRYASEFAKLYQ